MDLALWPVLQPIFEEALDLPPERRAAFLAERCGTGTPLLAAAEELLAADALADPGFLAPAPEDGAPLDPFVAGRRVGPFRILRRLAAGGMGAVYEAAQDDLPRTVALKVLKPLHSFGPLLRRFRREADILARLRHPGIAQVHAAGVEAVAEGGLRLELPWYAMEYLQGAVPITEYADRQGLALGARAALFERVLDAVAWAHARGVVHRDLKPANVLVDPDGAPKVIDFGVARELPLDGTDVTRHTAAGELIGTLAYMAPEQVLGDPDRVDTRADVYGAGALLHELLCGAPPRDLRGLPLAAAVLAVRDVPPRRPRSFRPDLPHELEWILQRALEQEPDRRYGSVRELADDLARCRLHEPLRAGPPGIGYRLAKFVRRHRLGTAAALLVMASLVAGLWTSVQAAGRARRSEARATAQARIAEHEAATTRMVVDFFRSAFARARLDDRGPDLRVVDLLADAGRHVREAMATRPKVAAGFAGQLAGLHASLGDYRAAASCMEDALAHLDAAGLGSSREALLAATDLVQCLQLQGDLERAGTTLERVLAGVGALEPPDPALRSRADGIQAALLFRRGRFREAEPVLRRVLDDRRARLGPGARATLESANHLSITLQELGRLAEAEPIARDVLARVEETLGADHPHAFLALNNLATLWMDLDRAAAARDLLAARLADVARVCGEDHPTTLLLHANLGQACRRAGDPARAATLLAEVLTRQRARLGAGHGDTLQTARNLAAAWCEAGEPGGAERMLRDLLGEAEGILAADHWGIALLRGSLGAVLAETGRPDQALPLLESAHASLLGTFGAGHRDTRWIGDRLADLREEPGTTPPAVQHGL